MWIVKWADTFKIQSRLFTDKTRQHGIFIFLQVHQSWELSF